MLRTIILLVLGLSLIGGCAHTGDGAQSGRSGRFISAEDVSPRHSTALDVVREVKPQWLRTRGIDSVRAPSTIRVYVDGMSRGGIASLDQIPAGIVSRIEFLNGSAATQRFGTGHGSGVIMVYTGRG